MIAGGCVLVGWLLDIAVRLEGRRAGLYESAFGMVLYGAAPVAILSLVVLWSGRSLYLTAQAREEAEGALREGEERYRALTENAYDLIAEVSLGRQLLYVSPNHKEVLGYDSSELVGKGSFDLMHPDDLPGVLAVFDKERAQAVFRFRHKNGEWRWFEGTGKTFRTRTGDDRGVIISRDITNRMRAEEQRAELEEKLRQAQRLDAVGQLAGGIAHDFNNQLAIIKGSTQFLLARLAADDPRRADAERILLTVDRGARLVRQLLTFSRPRTDERKSVDLTELVREMEPMLRVLLGEQIALRVETAPGLWPVLADPVQIEQVIMNLVANAKDAMPETADGMAGTVSVAAANVEPCAAADAFAADPLSPGEYVLLTVRDTGCGMAAELRDRIFEPYFTTKPPGKGTGLGLSTVSSVVKQLGGRISCTSQPGHGTTFTVYLSREQNSAVFPTRPQPPGRTAAFSDGTKGVGPAGATVLVAENEALMRELITEVLNDAGYHVHAAGHAADALAVAAQLRGSIDLLVSDIAMPDESGMVLARRLARSHPTMRVLFISGYPGGQFKDTIMPGARFLQKPFDISLLLQHARELLDDRPPPHTHRSRCADLNGVGRS